MAELNERDRRILLGEDHVQAERDAVHQSPLQRAGGKKGLLDRNSQRRPGAIAIFLTGLLMAALHLRETPKFDAVTVSGAVIALLGAAWLAWLIVDKKRIVSMPEDRPA